MTLDPKALEAAKKFDIEGTAHVISIIEAYLDAADLPHRCTMAYPCRLLCASTDETIAAIRERDEARREAEKLQDKLDFAAEHWGKSDREVDQRGKQMAAMREAHD